MKDADEMTPKDVEHAGRAAAPAGGRPPAAPIKVVDSRSLFGDRRELHIEHNGERYLLRMTRLGKLILTK